MSTWIIEKDMLDALGKALDFPVFLEIAPDKQKEPFGILRTISTGSIRNLDYFHPLFQLDAYERNPEKATRLAEETIGRINGMDAHAGITLFDSIRAERAMLIRVEDGTYKMPIEITANCIRRE